MKTLFYTLTDCSPLRAARGCPRVSVPNKFQTTTLQTSVHWVMNFSLWCFEVNRVCIEHANSSLSCFQTLSLRNISRQRCCDENRLLQWYVNHTDFCASAFLWASYFLPDAFQLLLMHTNRDMGKCCRTSLQDSGQQCVRWWGLMLAIVGHCKGLE